MTTTERRVEYWLEHPDRFWIANPDGTYTEVDGHPVGIPILPEADLFVNQTKTEGGGFGWVVSCGVTGFCLNRRVCSSPKAAIRYAGWVLKALSGKGVNFGEMVRKAVTEGHLSPRYRMEEYDE